MITAQEMFMTALPYPFILFSSFAVILALSDLVAMYDAGFISYTADPPACPSPIAPV